jgi:NTE family protein
MGDRTPSTGLVIAGAGARGAYEMGALSVLVPWLRRRGQPPRVVVGTSAGAINAVLVASMLDWPDPDEAVEAALSVWRGIGGRSVFRPLALTAPVSALRYLAGVAGLDGGIANLLDPAPLRRMLDTFESWDALHANVSDGLLDAVAVVTTAMSRARTEVFVETRRGIALPPDDDDRAVVHTRTRLESDHVMASAAIPVAFPPVRIDDGWYLDGGVRLNAPIRPALALGADRLVVVATHPLRQDSDPTPGGDEAARGAPDIFTAGGTVLSAAFVDRMVEDVRSLDRVNRLLDAGATGTDYRRVPYVFCGPTRGDSIAEAARDVLGRRYEGVAGLLSLPGADYAVLNRLVGGSSRTHAELLSFLLFEPDFVERVIELGRRDAQLTVDAAGADPWRSDSARPA